MKLFDVYPRFPVEIVRGLGATLWDGDGTTYLDMYGGHAVLSIGHGHPRYVERITRQLRELGFYSNSVQLPIQEALAERLGALSGYPDYALFLCNSGAEATENALKLASFRTGRDVVVACRRGFHGRTSAAVAVTDSPAIQAPLNRQHAVRFVDSGDVGALEAALADEQACALIVEGLQGIGGIHDPGTDFLTAAAEFCRATGTMLILDEIQSGYGRTGEFFAHQATDIRPDLITVAKGMGNGFPIGGVLIAPEFEARPGLLGTTFGGNPLACAAGLAVLEVLAEENLIARARELGDELLAGLRGMGGPIREIRGRGLMIGIELEQPCADLRRRLLDTERIFTGSSSDPNTLRLLPPLTIGEGDIERFLSAFRRVLAVQP